MPQEFEFSIISPDELVFQKPVQLAVMPGEEGEFGVGKGHTALIAALKAGVVRTKNDYNADDYDNFWFVTGGYADVDGSRCSILADSIESLDSLDSKKLHQDLGELHEKLAKCDDKYDRWKVEKDIKSAIAAIKAIEMFGKK